MTSTILNGKGGSFQRVVRSQRTYKGVRVGAIRDKGYLVLCRFDGIGDSGCWTPIKVIRKR